MTRTWGSTLGVLALSAIALTGCSGGATDPTAGEGASDEAAAEAVEPALDLSNPDVIGELCHINDNALTNPAVTNAATTEVPEYWTANFPAVPGDGTVYCEQTLNSNGLTTTWVILDDTVAGFPVLEQWVSDAQAAGYATLTGAGIETTRQVANGEVIGTANSQLSGDGKEFFAGFRSFDDRYLQIWIQPAP